MPQARGALTKYLLQFETTFRTAPSPAAKLIPISTWGIDRDANRQDDKTITSSPLPAKSDKGDAMVGKKPFTSVLDLRSIGNWLKGLFGAATVGKAVITQPVNITGVTIQYASGDCTSGVGTLTWAIAGTTLGWTPQAGTIGTLVNVSAGGDFTLLGGGGGKSLRVSVIAGALPAGNQTDATINVSASLKAHVFPIDLADRPSMLLEAGHSDISKYRRFLGNKVNKLSWDILNNEQNIAGEIIGAVEVDPIPTAAFDAAPTSYAQVRACAGGGVVSDGGSTLGTIVAATFSGDNQMTGYPAADGLEGYGFIDQGDLLLSGSIKTVFDGASAYALARAGTSTRLRMVSSAVTGADTHQLIVDMPACELTEKWPAIEGKSGMLADLNWRAHESGVLLPTVVLVNDVASY